MEDGAEGSGYGDLDLGGVQGVVPEEAFSRGGLRCQAGGISESGSEGEECHGL